MKISDIKLLVITIIFSCVLVPMQAQKAGTSLRKALTDLQKEFGVQFVYDDALVNNLNIKLDASKEKSLDQKLSIILSDLNLSFSKIDNKYYAIKQGNISQKPVATSLPTIQESKIIQNTYKITGVVTDQNNETAIGVTVMVKNTLNGTTTDENGGFELEVKGNEILQFSYIGYQTIEFSIGAKKTMNVKMLVESNKLEEVVVVAFGTQKRANVTGAVATLNTKELSKLPVDNLTTMLSGRLPGVITRQQSGVPGDNAAKFFIRGRSSPTGSGAPLIIVDGVERPFDNLDPNEIETITILKDAASASMYGVRAANGVVMVTTKRGSSGQKINLSYTSSFSASTNTAFPEYPDGVNYAQWHNKARALDNLALDYSESDIDKIRNGDPAGILGNTEWTKLIFEPFGGQTYQNLNITGGNGKLKFFNNASYLKQNGVIKGVSFSRVNLRSSIDYEVTPNFTVGLNLAGRAEDRMQPGTSAGSQDITINNYKNLVFYSILARPTTNAFLPDGETYLGWGNALAARDGSGFNNRKNKIFQSTASLKYKIPQVPGLSVRSNLSYDYENGFGKWFITPSNLASWDYAQRRVILFNRLMPKDVASDKNELTQRATDFTRTTMQFAADYNRAFGKNNFTGLILFEEQSTKTNAFSVAGQDLPLTSLPDLNFATQYIPNSLSGSRGQSGTRGLVSRLGYIRDDKYMAEFTGRVDWSSKFPADARMGIFPAVSLGWNISREAFFAPLSNKITNLKIRGSAGILGNDDIGDFRYLKTFNLSNQPQVIFGNNGYLDLLSGPVPNYDIKWERTTTYNAGFEMELLKGMFIIEVDAFYKLTTDILQSAAGVFPPSFGGNFPSIVNNGRMDARGFEAIVTHRKNITKNLNYSISANLTFSRNKYLQTDESLNVPAWQRRTGQPLGSVLGWVSDGLFQSEKEISESPVNTFEVKPGFIKYKDLNGDGVVNFADRTWIARSPIPEVIGGFNTSVGYKNLNINLFFQGATRTDLMLTGEYLGAGFSDGTFFTQPFKWGANTPYFLLENTWQKEGDITEFPRLTTVTPFNNNLSTDFWRRNASYLRLKTAELSYNFRLSRDNKPTGTMINVYLSGSNLWTLSRLKFIDPEAPTVNNGFYPQQRVYNFGINLSI